MMLRRLRDSARAEAGACVRTAACAGLFWMASGVAAARAQDSSQPADDITYEKGKTTIRWQHGELVLSNKVQLRWIGENPDLGALQRAFDVSRAKTQLTGWIIVRRLTYEIQFNWRDGSRGLDDLYITWRTSKSETLRIQAGQFKVPFGRQCLTSFSKLQFVDRSIVTSEFTEGRDIGLQVSGLLAGKRVEYRVGVFNGSGHNELRNATGRRQYNARVMVQPLGEVKYSEGDFESGDRLIFAIAGNFEYSDRRGATSKTDFERRIAAFDTVIKYRGFSLFVERFVRRLTPESGLPFLANGVQAETGCFVIPNRVSLATRYARLAPKRTPTSRREEVGMAINYFLRKHDWKLQSDLRRVTDARRGHARELRAQLQMTF